MNNLSLDALFNELVDPVEMAALIERARVEDLGERGDITSQVCIDARSRATGRLCSRTAGTAAGLLLLADIAAAYDSAISVERHVRDGQRIQAGDCMAELNGPYRSLLAAERVILNFISFLSGIATMTARYVEAVSGTNAAILDTRKTLPGWRTLSKYAVRCGGGQCHRIGLHDAVLIKDNHLAAVPAEHLADYLSQTISAARSLDPPPDFIEVEVDNLAQFGTVMGCDVDIILLDNMRPDMLRQAVAMRQEQGSNVLLEASGGVNLQSVAAIARSGVDRISVGALTHSVAGLDVGLDFA